MKLSLLMLFALCATYASPQAAVQAAPGPAPAGKVTKIVRVRYVKPQKVAYMAANGLPVFAEADDTLQAIVLKGDPEAVASAERTIHELDIPSTVPSSKDIELIVSVIGGSNNTTTTADAQIPPEIAPVVKQLRAIFPYQNYEILSSMMLRSRADEQAGNEGVMKGLSNTAPETAPTPYSLHYDAANVSVQGGRPIIHLKNFRFFSHIDRVTRTLDAGGKPTATQTQRFNIDINTGVDIADGQRIVAGKANIDTSDSALFLVLTAKLVD